MSADAPVRRIGTMAELPERLTSADRIAHMHTDVQDATAKMRAVITDKSAAFTVQGYTLDEESWEVAYNGRTVIMSALIRRPA